MGLGCWLWTGRSVIVVDVIVGMLYSCCRGVAACRWSVLDVWVVRMASCKQRGAEWASADGGAL